MFHVKRCLFPDDCFTLVISIACIPISFSETIRISQKHSLYEKTISCIMFHMKHNQKSVKAEKTSISSFFPRDEKRRIC